MKMLNTERVYVTFGRDKEGRSVKHTDMQNRGVIGVIISRVPVDGIIGIVDVPDLRPDVDCNTIVVKLETPDSGRHVERFDTRELSS